MATTTVLKSPPTYGAPSAYVRSTSSSSTVSHVSFACNKLRAIRCRVGRRSCNKIVPLAKLGRGSFGRFVTFAADGDAVEAQTETQEKEPVQGSESESEPEAEDINTDGAIDSSASESDVSVTEEPSSVVLASLNSYKEALANNNEEKVAEIESFLKSIEDEKSNLESKVATVSEELSYERDRVLRISADFDNFRKRTERDRLSLVTNAQGELVERLLPVLDNFERAKAQIKVENEAEEKINNSYQSIYKQFVEILGSLGVVPVETVGKPFDPMLHEAIMREDSTEYEDGVVMEEYRKGFILGERLLRPSMVKVSAGPGPAKPETENNQSEDQKETEETSSEETSSEEAKPADE